MKRKTAIKKLMGMGYSRNDAETKLCWARAFDWSNEAVVRMLTVRYQLRNSVIKVMDRFGGACLTAGEAFAKLHNAIYDDHDISGLLEED